MKEFGGALVFLTAWLSVATLAWGQTTEMEKKQFELLKAQAEKGDPQAQLSLGSLYASGRGVPRDLTKAAKWHRKAAEQGLARAQLRVAYEYADGLGVKSDHVEAVRWLRRAADQRLAEAQYQLGLCYSKGDGITESPVEAVKLYQKAADQNYPDAQFELGNCYFEGNGVTKDIPEAVDWTRKAAEQGFAPAQNSLGMCYAKGKGVAQNYLEAYKWFDLAAAQSGAQDVEAKMNLSMAERAMTPEQVAQAQKMAHEFKTRTGPSGPALGTADVKNNNNTENVVPGAGPTKSGFVNVKADDETYEVYLDGAFVGNAPAKLKLDPGEHLIEVKKQGFKDFKRQIKVTEGSELSLRAVLDRQ
jgi:TPR repeat protein